MKKVRNLRLSVFVFLTAACFAASAVFVQTAVAQAKNAQKKQPAAKTKQTPAADKKEKSAKSAKDDPKSKSAKTAKKEEKPKSSKDKTAPAAKDKNAGKKAAESKKAAEPKSRKTDKAKNSESKSSKTTEKTASVKKTAEKSRTVDRKTETKSADRSVKAAPKIEKPVKTTQPKFAKTERNEKAPEIIVGVTSARVRTEPALSAATVGFAKLGARFEIVEQTARWYKVRLTDSGKTGWISMEVASDFDAAKREAIYANLLKKYYKEDDTDFHTSAEVFEFLTRARDEAATEQAKAELGFKRYLALRSALKAIPQDKFDQEPYKTFLKANDEEIVYSEPSAEWHVRANLLWELYNSHAKSTIAEEIAWQAARNPIPGECEGYTNCYIYLLRVTDGEYLNFYPNGKHAQTALRHITDFLEPIAADAEEKKIYAAPTDTSDRADFNQLLTELRTIISRLPFAEKSRAIQHINQIAEGYR